MHWYVLIDGCLGAPKTLSHQPLNQTVNSGVACPFFRVCYEPAERCVVWFILPEHASPRVIQTLNHHHFLPPYAHSARFRRPGGAHSHRDREFRQRGQEAREEELELHALLAHHDVRLAAVQHEEGPP